MPFFSFLLYIYFSHVLYIVKRELKYRMVPQVIEAQVDMPIFGAVALYSSLLTFALHVHPDRLDYADLVLVHMTF